MMTRILDASTIGALWHVLWVSLRGYVFWVAACEVMWLVYKLGS